MIPTKNVSIKKTKKVSIKLDGSLLLQRNLNARKFHQSFQIVLPRISPLVKSWKFDKLDRKLKTENWKHCSKIIFKCVNSTVRPIFNKKVVKNWYLWVPWTIYGCTVHAESQYSQLKKKKKKKAENANAKRKSSGSKRHLSL